eukprot:1313893-Pyramimonas_sp.AAC.1
MALVSRCGVSSTRLVAPSIPLRRNTGGVAAGSPVAAMPARTPRGPTAVLRSGVAAHRGLARSPLQRTFAPLVDVHKHR